MGLTRTCCHREGRGWPHGLWTVVIVLCSGCPERAQTGSTAKPSVGQRPVVVVVSGDTQGWLMPCGCTSNQSGGLARRASYLDQLRKTSDVLALDVGGAGDGTAPYQLEKLRAILRGERAMNVSLQNLGASEIACGAQTLRELSQETGMAFVSCNVEDATGQPVSVTHQLIELGGRRILVTGVVSRKFAVGEGLKVKDPEASLLRLLSRETAPRDWLIVLAYLPEDELRALAQRLPEVDLLIGGPTGQSLAPQRVARVWTASATNKGKFLVQAHLPNNAGQPGLKLDIVEMSPQWPDEPGQMHNLRAFRDILKSKDFPADQSGLQGRFGNVSHAERRVVGMAACATCHAAATEIWNRSAHGHAWQTLQTDNAFVDSACQQCHVTGFGQPAGFVSALRSPQRVDVGCENCHGPSSEHVSNPRVRTPLDARGSCVLCHDHENSPHFDFASFWERIKHE